MKIPEGDDLLFYIGLPLFKFEITAFYIINSNRIMYPNYIKPQGNQPNNTNNNQAKSPQTFAPFIQPPQFINQPFLSPQGQSFNPNRNVYASTIQPSTSSSSHKEAFSGLSKL